MLEPATYGASLLVLFNGINFRARGEHIDGQGSSLSRAAKGATFMVTHSLFCVYSTNRSTLHSHRSQQKR